jgi:hypothetical protein
MDILIPFRLMLAAILRAAFVMALVAAAITPASFSRSSSQSGEKVWYWFSDCQSGKMMGVEVLLDGKSIYRTEFRICSLERNDPQSAGPPNIKAFYFSGGHTFQGGYHTTKTQRIEGDIWQAGADPDALLLGVSFMTKNRVLLNTLHIAKPGKATESEIDTGIVVRTYPLRSLVTPSAK